MAIDGAAGSGKSTIAKAVAKRLNFFYLDTGAMYRAATLKYINKDGDQKIMDSTIIQDIISNTTIDLHQQNDEINVFLDGKDVSLDIRTIEVSKLV